MGGPQYRYTAADRPDKKDLKLSREFTKKKADLGKALATIKPTTALHMFQTDDGLPVRGVSSGSAFHVTWECRVDEKNLPKEGCSVLDVVMLAITRLQYIQTKTEINYPTNDEALLHLYNAAVILNNGGHLDRDAAGLVDIHKAYS